MSRGAARAVASGGAAPIKGRGSKGAPARSLPPDAARLLELILAEVRAPRDSQKLLAEWPAVETCAEEAGRFLRAKDRAQRRADFIANERLWFNKYGWFMARAATYFGLLAFLFFLASRGVGVDFLTALILGAAGYYLLLVTMSNLRYRERNKRRRRLLRAEAERYQREIVRVAAALLKRFGVATERYPVGEPHTPAGLEQRADGYFIPVD